MSVCSAKLLFLLKKKNPTISTLSVRWSLGIIMVPIRDCIDQECYLVTKHSWKGKYKRILAIGKTGISTYNPDKLDVTNRWPYSDVVAIAPNKSIQNVMQIHLLETLFFLFIFTLGFSLCIYFHLVKPWVFINFTKRPETWYH